MMKNLIALGRQFYEAVRWTKRYNRVFIIGDGASWVLDSEARKLCEIAAQLEIDAALTTDFAHVQRQCVYFTSQFVLMHPEQFFKNANRIAIDYYHGQPERDQGFQELFDNLKHVHERISRIRVSNSMMERVVLGSGIAPAKVFRIPIGIDTEKFSPATVSEKRDLRRSLGLPEHALLIGSFQKDGNGWGEGFEPKLIKGPDIFLNALKILKTTQPHLHVLLTGPARGYVMKGLHEMDIPYSHVMLEHYEQIPVYFKMLDLYLVSSREEGGPKAVLEAMASGIPLVTTNVGQAADLVKHGENAWMVEVEDVEGLAYWAEYVAMQTANLQPVLQCARRTAEQHTYQAQLPLWEQFFRGYIYV